MAAAIDGVFPDQLQEKIKKSKVLVVGAGGIGCEVLKNLVMSGFPDIEIIDLDTIDLSNLNRQFLFHREHVGKSKANVARESALQFNPDVDIKAYHDSIFSTDYGVNFFKKFDVVLSALDNQSARNHVNRMCLNADVVLIESGTAGYNGQVEVIKRGFTQCYECTPKARQKTFPGCTIRNTPSEPIHCIVWAKHLFNQLFGETVDDEDISPDMADPEAQENSESKQTEESNGDSLDKEEEKEKTDTGNIVRVNTRQWAKDCNYDPKALFNKFFFDDIKYLLSMENLWKTRKAPTPVTWESCAECFEDVEKSKHDYHAIWPLVECAKVFEECLQKLHIDCAKLTDGDSLVWDKDDQPAMDFVAACANIRAYIFQISRKSRFEIKSMAGNIIPAIATTNAIIGGIVVLRAFNVLQEELDKCKSVYSRLRLNARQQLIIPDKNTIPPNPQCYVCAKEPAIHLRIDTNNMRIKDFRDEVLIKTLNMVNPDVEIEGTGMVIISSEEGETEENDEKLLKDLYIVEGAVLKCDDFFQNYELRMVIIHIDAERDQPQFEVIADKSQLQPKDEKEESAGDENADSTEADEGPSTSKKRRIEDDDDDLQLIEEEDDDVVAIVAADKLTIVSPTKEEKTIEEKGIPTSEQINIDSDEITEILDSDEEISTTKPKSKALKHKLPSVTVNIPEKDALDGGGDVITEILDSDEEEEHQSHLKRKRPRFDNGSGDVINID